MAGTSPAMTHSKWFNLTRTRSKARAGRPRSRPAPVSRAARDACGKLARALYAAGALDFNLGLSALGVLERAVHDEDDGNPRRHEVGEEQAQKHDKASGCGYVDLHIVPDQAGHDGADRDERDIEDECFHAAFRSVTALGSQGSKLSAREGTAINHTRCVAVISNHS